MTSDLRLSTGAVSLASLRSRKRVGLDPVLVFSSVCFKDETKMITGPWSR